MTPAVKFLEKQGVTHTVHRYELGESQSGTYGEAVAKAIGAEPQRVFKTLIAQLNSGELVVAVVPVSGTLDLRALAAAAGAKSACDGTSAGSREGNGLCYGRHQSVRPEKGAPHLRRSLARKLPEGFRQCGEARTPSRGGL